jgi:hypothetical protein
MEGPVQEELLVEAEREEDSVELQSGCVCVARSFKDLGQGCVISMWSQGLDLGTFNRVTFEQYFREK